jgi:mannose-1-phosphate guanylyltransferase
MEMKAVILAGGFGKRLRPLTDTTPKPLIEIGGTPILAMQLDWLKQNSIFEAILCIGFLKEKIIDFVGNGKRFGVKVGYVVEEEPLGTGGAVLNAEPLLRNEDKFIVLNGDVITNLDPTRLGKDLAKHVGILALVPLKSQYGIVDTDSAGLVSRFREKPILSEYWINAGVYYLTPKIFDYLKDKSNIETTAFPKLAAEGRLKAFKYDGCFWKSIDVHKDIEEAEIEIKALKKT